jgi:hypothetical protein
VTPASMSVLCIRPSRKKRSASNNSKGIQRAHVLSSGRCRVRRENGHLPRACGSVAAAVTTGSGKDFDGGLGMTAEALKRRGCVRQREMKEGTSMPFSGSTAPT